MFAHNGYRVQPCLEAKIRLNIGFTRDVVTKPKFISEIISARNLYLPILRKYDPMFCKHVSRGFQVEYDGISSMTFLKVDN